MTYAPLLADIKEFARDLEAIGPPQSALRGNTIGVGRKVGGRPPTPPDSMPQPLTPGIEAIQASRPSQSGHGRFLSGGRPAGPPWQPTVAPAGA